MVFGSSVTTSQKTHLIFIPKTNRLMLFWKIFTCNADVAHERENSRNLRIHSFTGARKNSTGPSKTNILASYYENIKRSITFVDKTF
jgi:hypothetical protein